MTGHSREALATLAQLLVEIRGIAGDAMGRGHVSSLGGGAFDSRRACVAIYRLADAAHNIPGLVTDLSQAVRPPQADYLEDCLENVAEAGAQVYGSRNPFAGVASQLEHPVPDLLSLVRPR